MPDSPFSGSSYPWTNPLAQKLHDQLARAYEGKKQIELLIDESGVDRASLHLDGTPKEIWKGVLDLAYSSRKLDALLDRILADKTVETIHETVREAKTALAQPAAQTEDSSKSSGDASKTEEPKKGKAIYFAVGGGALLVAIAVIAAVVIHFHNDIKPPPNGGGLQPKIPEIVVELEDAADFPFPREPDFRLLDTKASDPGVPCKDFLYCIHVPGFGYFPLGPKGIRLSQSAQGANVVPIDKPLDCGELKVHRRKPGPNIDYSACEGNLDCVKDEGVEQCILRPSNFKCPK